MSSASNQHTLKCPVPQTNTPQMAYSKIILNVGPYQTYVYELTPTSFVSLNQCRPKCQLMLISSQSGSLCFVRSKTLLGLLTSKLVPMLVYTYESIGSQPIFMMNFNINLIFIPKSSKWYHTFRLSYPKFILYHIYRVSKVPSTTNTSPSSCKIQYINV